MLGDPTWPGGISMELVNIPVRAIPITQIDVTVSTIFANKN